MHCTWASTSTFHLNLLILLSLSHQQPIFFWNLSLQFWNTVTRIQKAILQQHTVGKMVPLAKLNDKLNNFHVTALHCPAWECEQNGLKRTHETMNSDTLFFFFLWCVLGAGLGVEVRGQVDAAHSDTTVAPWQHGYISRDSSMVRAPDSD